MTKAIPQVIIVGAGFGGLQAARSLAKARVQVTLLDRNNYHLFQPLLYQVATAGLSPDDIAYPVRAILRRQKNLEFRLAEVRDVRLNEHCLVVGNGCLPYNYLILAVGGETNYFGLETVAHNAYGLKGIRDATAIRNHLLRQFELAAQEKDPERRAAELTIVAVGGGPTGVECSGAISELVRLVLAKDYPQLNLEHVQNILLEANDSLLPGMPTDLSQETVKILRRKHVEVRFSTVVTGFDGEQVTLKNGETIAAQTLIWAAGVRASKLLDGMGITQAGQRRARVTPALQLPDHPEVFVIGDAAYLENGDGNPLPMVAPVAIQQAKIAAENILRTIDGKPLVPFEYKDPGSLATVGRNAAVARLGKWKFKGSLAWLLWLVVHIVQLIGFRNRLVVLINWFWDYIFYDRAIRLIDADDPRPDH